MNLQRVQRGAMQQQPELDPLREHLCKSGPRRSNPCRPGRALRRRVRAAELLQQCTESRSQHTPAHPSTLHPIPPVKQHLLHQGNHLYLEELEPFPSHCDLLQVRVPAPPPPPPAPPPPPPAARAVTSSVIQCVQSLTLRSSVSQVQIRLELQQRSAASSWRRLLSHDSSVIPEDVLSPRKRTSGY
ncbi:unnamed protein product [Pleuronectes platessa]|uniref:Uncharacterized protein n=1 Tax=Pleuronectes platessa TaxID=8262 RepID=A0A9N7V095_PLEPL|nr:unnamed protein product [Pleuronectes platessa]